MYFSQSHEHVANLLQLWALLHSLSIAVPASEALVDTHETPMSLVWVQVTLPSSRSSKSTWNLVVPQGRDFCQHSHEECKCRLVMFCYQKYSY